MREIPAEMRLGVNINSRLFTGSPERSNVDEMNEAYKGSPARAHHKRLTLDQFRTWLSAGSPRATFTKFLKLPSPSLPVSVTGGEPRRWQADSLSRK
jgi:hypothetical protein